MSRTPECAPILDSPLGKELEQDECQVLADIMGVRDFGDGEILVREGDEDSTLFVLAAGKLGVSSFLDGKNVSVYNLKAGEVAGTRAFVDQSPRGATLKSIGDTTVYTLEPADFDRLVETHPRIVYKVMRGLFRITHMNLMRMNLETHQLENYITKTGGRY